MVFANFDYYPFGMMMPGRKYDGGSSYRYGFNGKENDEEIKGDGNSYDYGARIYDPRIGRWLSPDRDNKAAWSPYSAFFNSPLIVADPDGNNEIVVIDPKTKTVTIYQPVIYNAKQNDILAKTGTTIKDLEKAANKKWEDSEHKKVMVDVGNGVKEEYTMSFKAIIIETKDDNEYFSKTKSFENLGIAYTTMELVENSPQSDYQNYGLEGHLRLTINQKDKAAYGIDMLAFMFVHEGFGHGSGLSHSLPVFKEIIMPNGRPGIGIDPSKSGITCNVPDNSFQEWEIQAIMDEIVKRLGSKFPQKQKAYYNIRADGENQNRNDAIMATDELKNKQQIKFIKNLTEPQKEDPKNETPKNKIEKKGS